MTTGTELQPEDPKTADLAAKSEAVGPKKFVIPNAWIPDIRVRQWIMGVVGATLPLLIAQGAITYEQGGYWLILAGAILGTGTIGLAFRNTIERPEDKAARQTGTIKTEGGDDGHTY